MLTTKLLIAIYAVKRVTAHITINQAPRNKSLSVLCGVDCWRRLSGELGKEAEQRGCLKPGWTCIISNLKVPELKNHSFKKTINCLPCDNICGLFKSTKGQMYIHWIH